MNPSIPSVRLSTLKIIAAGLLLALLSACSAIKVAYNNGHEVAWWWLTDYVEVQGEDKATLRQAVHQLHEWHRRDQLASYVEMLRSWQVQMNADLNGEQVCRMVDDVMQRAAALSGAVQVLEPPALQVLARLSARQIAEMERQFAKGNRKFREKYVDVTPRELLDNRVESGVSRAEWLYGSLGRAQEQALRTAMMAAPWDAREAYAARLRRQQDIVQTLRQLSQSQASTEQARVALRSLLLRQIEPQEPAERSRTMAWRQQSCQVLAQLHASTTPAQRSRAQETLRNYATDLASLVPAR
jgi:Family of unknown function (DUF6279)